MSRAGYRCKQEMTLKQMFTSGLILLLTLSAHAGDAVADRPNVVFILSDDQGWTDDGFMGHQYVQTPHLDALAREGMLYERGYVTAPLCRPSLASIVTGLYPHQTRIRGNDPVMPDGQDRRSNPPLWSAMRSRMTAPMMGHPSFIKILKQNGYATLQTGKWWEGGPKDHGFTDASRFNVCRHDERLAAKNTKKRSAA